jgi:hypothetical protein
MKTSIIRISLLLIILVIRLNGQTAPASRSGIIPPNHVLTTTTSPDTVADLRILLNTLAANSTDSFFTIHCNSIQNVIEANIPLTGTDSAFLKQLYITFSDSTVQWCGGTITSYRERKRPFIISWTSATDGAVSLAWLVPPENWDSDQTYPLYVHLHGLWSPYQNPIEYMSFYLRPDSILNKTYEDGYLLLPWGRGNLWYTGISETDVLEAVDNLESIVHVNPKRKYLVGHSMGGFGVWSIGQKYPEMWTALGIGAGALWYDYGLLNAATAEKLKNTPVCFVCGDQDGLLSGNQTTYRLLQEAGNPNIVFITFHGGHESLLVNWQNMYQWLRTWESGSQNEIQQRDDNAPTQFTLYGNYPNPFNPTTTIKYSLPEESRVNIGIYNQLGQNIVTLVEKTEPAGDHTLTINAGTLSSCVYFCRIRAEGHTTYQKTQKMVLLR